MIDGNLLNFTVLLSVNIDKLEIMSKGISRIVSSSRRHKSESMERLLLDAVEVEGGSYVVPWSIRTRVVQ